VEGDFWQKTQAEYGNRGQGWTTGDTVNLRRFFSIKGADNSSIAG